MESLAQSTPLNTLRSSLLGLIGDRDVKKIGRHEACAILAESRLSEHGKRIERKARDELEAFDPVLVETVRFIVPVIPEVRKSLSGREWLPWSRLLVEMQILGEDEYSNATFTYLQCGILPDGSFRYWAHPATSEAKSLERLQQFFDYFPVVSYLSAMQSHTVVAHMLHCCHTKLLWKSHWLEKLSAAKIKLRRDKAVLVLRYVSSVEQENLVWAINGVSSCPLDEEKRNRALFGHHTKKLYSVKRYHSLIDPDLPNPFSSYLYDCSDNLSISKVLGVYKKEREGLLSWLESGPSFCVIRYPGDTPFSWASEAMQEHGKDIVPLFEAYIGSEYTNFALVHVGTLLSAFHHPHWRREAARAFWRVKTPTTDYLDWVPTPDVISAKDYARFCMAADPKTIYWTGVLQKFLSTLTNNPMLHKKYVDYKYFVTILDVLLGKGADIENTRIWEDCSKERKMAVYYVKRKKTFTLGDYRTLVKCRFFGEFWADKLIGKELTLAMSAKIAAYSVKHLLPSLMRPFAWALPPTPPWPLQKYTLTRTRLRNAGPTRLLSCYEIVGDKLVDWSVDREETLRSIMAARVF